MKKIMVIGCGGAGKSTLARKVHNITGLPLIHMDQHFWSANWEEPDKLEWKKTVDSQSDAEEWIMDGNYGGTMDIRLRKADVIIFLDRSRWLCLYRVLLRQLKYWGRTRPDMTEGCVERVNWKFLHYIFRYNETRRPGILDTLKTLQASKNVFILRNEKEVNKFLEEIKLNIS